MRFEYLVDEQKEKIKLDYLSGKSCQKIADEIGVSGGSMQTWVKKLGVLIRSQKDNHRRYNLNRSIFDEITSDSAYWIGFLMADGNVRIKDIIKHRGHDLRVSLNEKDLSHLYKFKDFLGYSGYIKRINSINKYKLSSITYGLNISSVDLVEKLISYGVVPNKSFTAKVIGLEDNRDFWRGVCDGDGSICILSMRNRPVISICGSKDLMEQFSYYARKIVPTWRGNVSKSRSIYAVQVSGNEGLVLMQNLYGGATTYLDRKYELAKRLTVNFNIKKET